MKKVQSCEQETRMVGIVVAIIAAIIATNLSGCALPLLLGVKSYQSGETKIDFITGGDVSAGFNGVDRVNDNRGISPGDGYTSKDVKEAKY